MLLLRKTTTNVMEIKTSQLSVKLAEHHGQKNFSVRFLSAEIGGQSDRDEA